MKPENLPPSHGNKGKTRSPKLRAQISATLSGRPGHKHTPESRAKISNSRKKSPAAQAQIRNLALAKIGKPSPLKGRHHSEETKAKMRLSAAKQRQDPNYRKNLSEKAVARCADPTYREQLSERVTKHYQEHPEARKIHSNLTKIQMSNPVARARLSECHLKEKNPMWKNGSSFYPYCPKFNDPLKEKVRNIFENECVLCHTTPEENGKKLSVHHVFTEKMACCESKIEEMEAVRRRLPKRVARFGKPEFSPLEIIYIRMMVPLCKKCHGKMIREEVGEIPYEKTIYRKQFVKLIMERGGKCF